jgi:hypothetical protein
MPHLLYPKDAPEIVLNMSLLVDFIVFIQFFPKRCYAVCDLESRSGLLFLWNDARNLKFHDLLELEAQLVNHLARVVKFTAFFGVIIGLLLCFSLSRRA